MGVRGGGVLDVCNGCNLTPTSRYITNVVGMLLQVGAYFFGGGVLDVYNGSRLTVTSRYISNVYFNHGILSSG